jgi:hypothetical protein
MFRSTGYISGSKRQENDTTPTSLRLQCFDTKLACPFYVGTLFGSFACGDWPDINIFRLSMVHYLEENERVNADDGYRGCAPAHAKTPRSITYDKEKEAMQARVRTQTVNKRFKHFGCLNKRFRHDPNKHSACFRAVAVITQIALDLGEPLFDVEYDDDL